MMALSGVRSSWLMLARNCDLWLARDFELSALFLHLREQIGILDRQHRLRREGLQQLDRVARKLAGLLAAHHQRAEHAVRVR